MRKQEWSYWTMLSQHSWPEAHWCACQYAAGERIASQSIIIWLIWLVSSTIKQQQIIRLLMTLLPVYHQIISTIAQANADITTQANEWTSPKICILNAPAEFQLNLIVLLLHLMHRQFLFLHSTFKMCNVVNTVIKDFLW